MSTRSQIAYLDSQGVIHSAYCHSDGYPEHQLPILQAHYGTLKEAKGLVDQGGMSSLRTERTWLQGTRRSPQPLFYHERGQEFPCSHLAPEAVQEAFSSTPCRHFYLYIEGQGWTHEELK